jgi:mRNA interferase RelE/StbE
MCRVEYSKQAMKALLKMPRNTAGLIRRKIEQLAMDPHAMPNVVKLVGRPGCRLRIGDWRVIFEVEEDKLVVLVLKIAPRGGAYE